MPCSFNIACPEPLKLNINIWFGRVIHIQLILFRPSWRGGKIEWMMAMAGGKYAKDAGMRIFKLV